MASGVLAFVGLVAAMRRNRSDYADIESQGQAHDFDAELDADTDPTLASNQARIVGTLGKGPGAAVEKKVMRATMPGRPSVKADR